MRKNIKASIFIVIIFSIFAGNLYAEEKNETSKLESQVKEELSKNDRGFNIFETLFPFPIISVETGWPEPFSLDLGFELLFHKLDHESRDGIYFLYNYAKGSDNKFYRISTGYAFGCMGLFEVRAGGGIGFMKENGDLLTTCFLEAGTRLFLLDLKLVFEIPLGPEYLRDYYRDNYFPLKFKIGISI